VVGDESRDLLGKQDHDRDYGDGGPQQHNIQNTGANGTLARAALLPESSAQERNGKAEQPWAERVSKCAGPGQTQRRSSAQRKAARQRSERGGDGAD